MLEIKKNQDCSCLNCSDKSSSTIKVSINRTKQNDNIVTFYLCEKCLNMLKEEFQNI